MERVNSKMKDRPVKNVLRYLTFFIGSELFGVAVEHVKEVIEYNKTYPIPRVPEYIHGVINLRGEVLPVLDLNHLLYRKKSEINAATSILFIEQIHGSDTNVTGIIIDAVEAVTDILQENIEATPAFGEKVRQDYINGIGKIEDRFIILLDILKVLNLEELSKFGAVRIS